MWIVDFSMGMLFTNLEIVLAKWTFEFPIDKTIVLCGYFTWLWTSYDLKTVIIFVFFYLVNFVAFCTYW